MKYSKIRYVETNNLDRLEKAVNDLINQGWQPISFHVARGSYIQSIGLPLSSQSQPNNHSRE